MKDIALVLWLILWPLEHAIEALIIAKTHKMKGNEQVKISPEEQKKREAFDALFMFIVWIIVAIIIKL